jgi:hypothetical protein
MLKSVLAGLLLLTAGTAMAADGTKEESIPFADMGSIRNFDPVDNHTILIEDVHGKWYKASLMGPCIDLPFATAVAFDVGGTRTLDRFSSVIVDGHRCAFQSLVSTDPPKGAKPRKPKG